MGKAWRLAEQPRVCVLGSPKRELLREECEHRELRAERWARDSVVEMLSQPVPIFGVPLPLAHSSTLLEPLASLNPFFVLL